MFFRLQHDEMDQKTRNDILTYFRLGKNYVLITTDLLACNMAVKEVPLIVNYDLPLSRELYINRWVPIIF